MPTWPAGRPWRLSAPMPTYWEALTGEQETRCSRRQGPRPTPVVGSRDGSDHDLSGGLSDCGWARLRQPCPPGPLASLATRPSRELRAPATRRAVTPWRSTLAGWSRAVKPRRTWRSARRAWRRQGMTSSAGMAPEALDGLSAHEIRRAARRGGPRPRTLRRSGWKVTAPETRKLETSRPPRVRDVADPRAGLGIDVKRACRRASSRGLG